MARYEKGRKDETHKRVVRLASERFRKDGIDGVAIATLMGDAGLTHGGFYSHFASKDALVDEAVEFAFSNMPPAFTNADDTRSELKAFVDWYLSSAHRDRVGKGCPIAALGTDFTRRSRSSRLAFFNGAKPTIDCVTKGLPAEWSDERRRETSMTLLAQLVGCLQLARLLPDKAASDRLLAAGRRTAHELAGFGLAPTEIKRSRSRKVASAA